MDSKSCALEIRDSYGSRSLSSLLPNKSNSNDEDITQIVTRVLSMAFRKAPFEAKFAMKPILSQIGAWIECNNRVDIIITTMRTLSGESLFQICDLLPLVLAKFSHEKTYGDMVMTYLDGKGILNRGFDTIASNYEWAEKLMHLMVESYCENILKWELSLFFYETKIVHANSYFASFMSNYRLRGRFPCPISLEQQANFNLVTLKCSIRFYESIPLGLALKNEYLSFLKSEQWSQGLLYSACKTGIHRNIEWVMDFLKTLVEPSLLWDIEPLSHGEHSVVAVLMSSDGTNKDIYYGLLTLIDANLPFNFFWDNLNSQSFPLSYVNEGMFTDSEKLEFNEKVIKSYSSSRIMKEIAPKIEISAVQSIVYAFRHHFKSNSVGLLENTLGSEEDLLFKFYKSRFKVFLSFLIRLVVQNSCGKVSTENGENDNIIDMSTVFELINSLVSKFYSLKSSIDEENKIVEAIKTENTIRRTLYQLKNYAESEDLFDDTSSAGLQKYIHKLGFKHGILNAAWSCAKADLMFECIRKLLQYPKVLSLEFALFNKYIDAPLTCIESFLRNLIPSKDDSFKFVFNAAGLENCIELTLKWHSFNFLFLILYPSSSKKPFVDFINYDLSSTKSDKLDTHKHVLITKFSSEGLLYRACGTLQQESIQWAIDYLASIDRCLVDIEMTMVYADDNTLLTHILKAFLDRSNNQHDEITEKDAGLELTNFRLFRISK